MKLTIDMETRSRIDLKKQGLYRYAEDPSTDIICIAFKIDNGATQIILPPKFKKLLPANHGLPLANSIPINAKSMPDIIEAHNAEFEMALWHYIMFNRYHFVDLPLDRIRCSAAKAAYYALPRSLEGAGSALNLQIQKDPVGKAIMMKMCKPRKATKTNDKEWHEDPNDLVKLCRYCMQDVDTEYELSEILPDIPEAELETWRLNHTINKRGIRIDVKGIESITSKIADSENKLLLDIQTITKGFVNSARQRDNSLRWLKLQGVDLPDFTKDTVIKALDKELPENVKRFLEIRQLLGKSSVAKFKSMQEYASFDGRMRGLFMWHGATTGRFTSKGPQVQNFQRDSYKDEVIDDIINLDNDSIEFMYDPIMKAASKCLRGMIVPSEGKSIISADFSQIELIVLAWLAHEEKILKQYRDNLPIYELAAADIYGKPYTQITKEERQIGKVFNLALGYQGWFGALSAMAVNYNIALPEEEICVELMTNWRKSRQATVRLWRNLEEAAIMAVKNKKTYKVGCLKLGIQNDFLRMKLPSGRVISYYQPKIEYRTTPYGEEKEVVTYMAMKAKAKNGPPVWCRVNTYGGKLTENATQAVAADILIEAMKRVENYGLFKVFMHVHDEVNCEVDDINLMHNKELITKKFEELMVTLPMWATGLPLRAETWVGKRYKK